MSVSITCRNSPPVVTGLSHWTLVAPSPSLHKEVINFYISLGFKYISEESSSSGLTTPSPSKTTWLHLFPNDRGQELGTDGVTLRIIVEAPSVPLNEEKFRMKTEMKLRELTIEHSVEESGWLCFAGANIERLREIFDKIKYPYDLNVQKSTSPVTTAARQVSLRTYDPLQNYICFSNTISAFSTVVAPVAAPAVKLPSNALRFPQTPSSSRKKNIGILTSGGDSSGMNAAVRSITRMALQKGCTPFAIFEGYQGLVDGGEYIKQLGWEDVQGMLSVGGTSIGTARCMAFRERAGRLTAAFNLVKNGIDALVVIGGDGSLTGADKLRGEWKGLIDELVQTGRLTTEESAGLRENLTIVGLVGSIDNDMSSTDITIGAVTSLHRICESLDSLTSTALSHQRAFIIEVMGRHCGWLGLMAAISVGADWVFLPERPPPLNSAKYGSDWQTELCDYIGKQRAMGNRKTIIIVCEGAIDNNLAPIRPEDVKTALEKGLSLDSRITTLGHVQRGGTPCAYDRFLATVQGVEAVNAVLRSTPETPSPMIGMNQNKITAGPLLEAVKLTKSVADAIASKDFKKAMDLRDPDFNAAYNAYVESTVHALEPGANLLPEGERLRIGIMHVGAPAGGMNAATRIAARLCLNRGHSCIGIRNGFAGLIRDDIVPLEYRDLHGWQVRGGSELGTSRAHPQPPTDGPKLHVVGDKFVDLGLIAYHLQKHSIDALLIVGGFEAYTSILTMAISRKNYPAFCIPMVHLPATVSNNVPGTDYSVGSDTALNAIVDSCDRLKLSANANKGRVFLVEVQGGNCGYLAVMGGLVAGATNVYIPEEGISLDMLQHDVHHLTNRYTVEKRTKKHKRAEGRLILRAEEASAETYTTEVVSNILRAEGRGLFDSRTAILGHLQQGNVPSPLDRIRATRLAVDCIDWIQKRAAHGRSRDQESSSRSSPLAAFPATYCPDGADACVIGVRGADVVFTPVEELLAETDLKARRGKVAWWMNLKELIRILAKHEYVEHDDLDGSRIDLTKQD